MVGLSSSRACRRATLFLAKALVVAGAVTGVVAAAGSAPAAAPTPPKWLTPRDLSEVGADAVIPGVALGPKGDVVVVWAEAKQSSWTVQAVDRPAGGNWGPPQALSVPADHVASPQVAIVGSRVAAIWERYDGKNLIAQAADGDPTAGAWNAPISLSPSGRDAQAPRIALDARGDEIAVWASVGFRGWMTESAYRPAGGSWQPSVPLVLPQAGTAAPDVVLDPSGNAVAAWASTSGVGWKVHAAYRGHDGTWSKAYTLSGSDASGSVAPHLALEGTNDVIAVWSRSLGTSTVAELATRDAATGAWSAAAQISPSGPDALTPEIAANKRGDVGIVWTSSDQSGLGVVALVRHAGKAWGPPAVLASAVSGPLAPQIALDPRGDFLVVLSHAAADGHYRVQAAALLAGAGSWSSPRALSTPGEDALTPQVGLDAEGDAAVVWARYNGQSFVIQGIGYDGSGPVLDRLVIPASGVVGKRLTFAATAKDVWAAVRTIRWSFGDGTTGTGRLTGHTYARAGRYAVQVTAPDSVGHVTSVRRWVRIAAA